LRRSLLEGGFQPAEGRGIETTTRVAGRSCSSGGGSPEVANGDPEVAGGDPAGNESGAADCQPARPSGADDRTRGGSSRSSSHLEL